MFHIDDSLLNKMKGLYTGKLVYTHSQSKTQTNYRVHDYKISQCKA